MTPEQFIAIIVAVGGLLTPVGVIATAIGVFYSIRVSQGNRRINLETKAVAVEAKEIALKTELNTNSMKDALVASTKVAAHLEGRDEARAEGEAKAATLAAGALVERAKQP